MKNENIKNQVKLEDQELNNISGGTVVEMRGKQLVSASELGLPNIVCAIGENGTKLENPEAVQMTTGPAFDMCTLGVQKAPRGI